MLDACSRLICYAHCATRKSNGENQSPYAKHRCSPKYRSLRASSACGESVPVEPPLWAIPLLAVRPRASVQLTLSHLLHEADVIVLGKVSVLL